MKKLFINLALLVSSSMAIAQYNDRDGNRIGISGGVSQCSLFTSNFTSKPGTGYAGGLSVRGNYYNNWSMIYGMQFFVNNFSLASSLKNDINYSLSGVQIRLLMSYNIIQDHISVDFGPVLQVNGKMALNGSDENKTIGGTLLKANDIVDVSKINGNAYIGISAGTKVVRALIFYQYGFTNVLGNLNHQDNLSLLNGNKTFKGNIGSINGQLIINL
ncbi:PorT family protein [Flavobacterium sp. SUN046]|uniref:PorT family protein n=1 Tax=Flavobacterium sp. SUN046 TaxID=3002440 RepID=UPI002DBD653F|nr:PorT family protein [Flavobacterium sp. SUN046]MEC4048166.1 PorT family protein [Flavobacterium sp. SUN046]